MPGVKRKRSWNTNYSGYKKQRTGTYGNRRTYYRAKRTFVPRTMGPFSVSESKYFDSYRLGANLVAPSTWAGTELDPTTLNTLVVPVEGSDLDNRIGRKISVYKISLRGVINPIQSTDDPDVLSSPFYRLILYLDQQTNGVQSQGEELMAAPGSAYPLLTINTFQNLASLGRFRVLKDVTYRPRIVTAGTDGTNTQTQNHSVIPFKMTVKFKTPVVMKFNATNAGTVGDIVDNSFHLVGMTSGLEFAPQLSYQCRAYYKDQ